jgi:hypothetical protein
VGRFSEVLAEVLDRTYAPASRVWLYTDAALSARSPDPVKCVVQLLEEALETSLLARAGTALRHLAGGESAWAFLMPEHIEKGAAWAGY